jgi:hypothetical protein
MKPKLYWCPACLKMVPITHFSCAAGAKGGATCGPSKARSREQAQAAANAGWAKRRAKA